MKTMPAGEFKAKCLSVMAEVNLTGQAVLVTKRGKPLARVLPFDDRSPGESPDAIFGCLSHMFKPGSDFDKLLEPVIPLEEWDHLKAEWSPFPSE